MRRQNLNFAKFTEKKIFFSTEECNYANLNTFLRQNRYQTLIKNSNVNHVVSLLT